MIKAHYFKEKDLLVVSIPSNSAIKHDSKERMKKEIKENSSIENVLIIEGTFEVV